MDSIGEILKNERMNRGLSLQEVNDATRITVQNLSALEESRFDYFPNRVYARAFLRDYSNFLGLDSASLLSRYEEGMNGAGVVVEAVPARSGGSAWKTVALSFLSLLVIAALAAAFYYGSNYGKKAGASAKVETKAPAVDNDVVTPPAPDKNAGVKETAPEPEPQPVPDKIVLELKTKQYPVWMHVQADGTVVIQGNTIPAQHVKTIEAQDKITVVVGLANQVEGTLNGKPVSFGTQSGRAEKTFTLEDVKAASGEGDSTSSPAAPAAPTIPGGPN